MFRFVNPTTQNPLKAKDYKTLTCPKSGEEFHKIDGVWRMIASTRIERFTQFIEEYELIRQAEGRVEEPQTYMQLPFTSADHPLAGMWAERAASFTLLINAVIKPLNKSTLTILDLGAGNGWLSNKLAELGHSVAAVDLTTNEFDGLGVHKHYSTEFVPIQAEFDQLPLEHNQFDLVIFNASLHYSQNFETTLKSSLRVCKPTGQIVIIDTPIYQKAETGRQMVAERETAFEEQFGTRSNSLESENFLTPARLQELASRLNLHPTIINRHPSWQLAARRLKRQLKGARPAAEFPLIILSQGAAT